MRHLSFNMQAKRKQNKTKQIKMACAYSYTAQRDSPHGKQNSHRSTRIGIGRLVDGEKTWFLVSGNGFARLFFFFFFFFVFLLLSFFCLAFAEDVSLCLLLCCCSGGVTNLRVVLTLWCVIAACARDAVSGYTEPPFVRGWPSRWREVTRLLVNDRLYLLGGARWVLKSE